MEIMRRICSKCHCSFCKCYPNSGHHDCRSHNIHHQDYYQHDHNQNEHPGWYDKDCECYKAFNTSPCKKKRIKTCTAWLWLCQLALTKQEPFIQSLSLEPISFFLNSKHLENNPVDSCTWDELLSLYNWNLSYSEDYLVLCIGPCVQQLIVSLCYLPCPQEQRRKETEQDFEKGYCSSGVHSIKNCFSTVCDCCPGLDFEFLADCQCNDNCLPNPYSHKNMITWIPTNATIPVGRHFIFLCQLMTSPMWQTVENINFPQ